MRVAFVLILLALQYQLILTKCSLCDQKILQIPEIHAHLAMAKKGKLLTALDAHKGRDYKLEKQKKQQKQAAKKKRTKAPRSNLDEKENVEAQANGTASMPEVESDGWESDESAAAEDTAVCRASTTFHICSILIRL